LRANPLKNGLKRTIEQAIRGIPLTRSGVDPFQGPAGVRTPLVAKAFPPQQFWRRGDPGAPLHRRSAVWPPFAFRCILAIDERQRPRCVLRRLPPRRRCRVGPEVDKVRSLTVRQCAPSKFERPPVASSTAGTYEAFGSWDSFAFAHAQLAT